MTQRIIRFLIRLELSIRYLLVHQAPGALLGVTLGLLGATLGLGYFTIEARIQALRYQREAIFRDEVLESYKRTWGRVDPAFCCHWRGRE